MVTRPPKLNNAVAVIRNQIAQGHYWLSHHAMERQIERSVSTPDILYVIKHGYEEKSKSRFDPDSNSWRYAIQGETLDGASLRVVCVVEKNGAIVVTVIRLEG